MTCRTLSKRLQRLETRMMPAGEPLVIQVQYVSPDGSVEDAPGLACRALEGVGWEAAAARGVRRS